MPIASIRLYLIVVLVSIVCLVNFIAAINGYKTSIARGEQLFDEQLVNMSESLGTMSGGQVRLPAETFGNDVIFQVWRSGILEQKSNDTPDQELVPLTLGFHMLSRSGVRWRTYTHYHSETDSWIIYGQRFDRYSQLIESMVLDSILPIIWVLPILALLIWLIVYFGLKPVQRLAQLLQGRDATDFRSVEEQGYPAELNPVVSSINDLFKRLRKAFEREQQFAADAAHELRTPLAALKINLHNHAVDHGLSLDSITELRASTLRMENSIEQLLALYRHSPESFSQALSQCQLQEIAQNAIIEFDEVLRERDHSIELEALDVKIQGDSFALSVLLKNLIGNAAKYTPAGGQIRVKVGSTENGMAWIEVHDSGPGIHSDELDSVFDRFVRAESSRLSNEILGSGLGLSIVKHIVELHDGKIELSRSKELGGLLVLVTLPTTQHSQ